MADPSGEQRLTSSPTSGGSAEQEFEEFRHRLTAFVSGLSPKEQEQLPEAIAQYRETRRLDPKYCEAHANLVYRLQLLRDWSALEDLYELPALNLSGLVPVSETLEPPILDDICLPPYVGSKHDDVGPLLRIARQVQPAIVLELGTAHGNTVANLCRVCPSARVYTVNALSEEQTGVYVTYVLDRSHIGRVYRRHGFADRVVQIYSNTLTVDLSGYLAIDSVDLAIIDACHDTKYVINDFHKTAPFVRSGGVTLLHDTHPSMHAHLAGSYIACMKLRRQGFDIRHLTGTWWAVWIKPEAIDGRPDESEWERSNKGGSHPSS